MLPYNPFFDLRRTPPSNTTVSGQQPFFLYRRVIQTDGNGVYYDGVGNQIFLSGIGTAGTSGGTSGSSGETIYNGTSGSSGTNGERGINGISGTSGSSGLNGSRGLSGFPGSSGSSGISGSSGSSGYGGYFVQAPPAPQGNNQGDRWYDTLTGIEFVWIDLGMGYQWISIGGSAGTSGTSALSVLAPIYGNGTSGDPVNLVYSSDFSLSTINTPGNKPGLSLNLDSTLIVAPSVSSSWHIYNISGTSAFSSAFISGATIGPTSTNNYINAPAGCKVNYSGLATIPIPGSGYASPSTVSGNYTFTPNPPLSYPAYGSSSYFGINTNTNFSVNLSKPKSGLIVVGSQVTRAYGNDNSSAGAGVTFQDLFYYGYLLIGPVSLPISQSTVNSITSSQIQGLGNYNFGGKNQAFSVNDGGAGLGAGWRVIFAYPASYGNLGSLNVTGSTVNQIGAFTKLNSPSYIAITTLSGASINYTFYVANADHSWNTTITIS